MCKLRCELENRAVSLTQEMPSNQKIRPRSLDPNLAVNFAADGSHPHGGDESVFSKYAFERVRQDEEFIVYRGRYRRQTDASPSSILAMTPVLERPALGSLNRMKHEYSLRAELDPGWAVQPLLLASHEGRTMLVLSDPGCEPLDRLVGKPMESTQFFRAAIGLSSALSQKRDRLCVT